jgi:tRNA threonylcarbamoyladenosine biosynthesis protein TsaE
MINFEFISHSAIETMNFAYNLASKLNIGDIVVLNGDLGAGKTKFTEGFLKYFGLDKEVSSPTFTIVNEYNANNLNIYHFDVYRLESSDEFYAIGGEDYFSFGICIIEWGSIISDALPNEYIQISFDKIDENENYRLITVKTIGNKYDKMFKNHTL